MWNIWFVSFSVLTKEQMGAFVQGQFVVCFSKYVHIKSFEPTLLSVPSTIPDVDSSILNPTMIFIGVDSNQRKKKDIATRSP